MGEPFTVLARCGAVLGSVNVQCQPENTVDEFLERVLRCQGASTSAPDVVRSPISTICKRSLIIVTSSFAVFCDNKDAVLRPIRLTYPPSSLCTECDL